MYRVAALLILFLVVGRSAAQEPTLPLPPGVMIVITPTPDGPPTETPTPTLTPTATLRGWDIEVYGTVEVTDGDDTHIQRVAFRYEMSLGELAIAVLLAIGLMVQLVQGLIGIWTATND